MRRELQAITVILTLACCSACQQFSAPLIDQYSSLDAPLLVPDEWRAERDLPIIVTSLKQFRGERYREFTIEIRSDDDIVIYSKSYTISPAWEERAPVVHPRAYTQIIHVPMPEKETGMISISAKITDKETDKVLWSDKCTTNYWRDSSIHSE